MAKSEEWLVRNAYWDDTGGITLEVKHPVYGWLPFSAHPDDPEEHGRRLYEAGKRGDYPVNSAPPKGVDGA